MKEITLEQLPHQPKTHSKTAAKEAIAEVVS